MEKYLDLTGMEISAHIEIAQKLVDEMTMEEKRILINFRLTILSTFSHQRQITRGAYLLQQPQ